MTGLIFIRDDERGREMVGKLTWQVEWDHLTIPPHLPGFLGSTSHNKCICQKRGHFVLYCLVGPSEDEQWWWYDQCAVMNCIRYNSDGTSTEADREGKKNKYIIIYYSFVLMKRMIKWIHMDEKKILWHICKYIILKSHEYQRQQDDTNQACVQWLKLLHIY